MYPTVYRGIFSKWARQYDTFYISLPVVFRTIEFFELEDYFRTRWINLKLFEIWFGSKWDLFQPNVSQRNGHFRDFSRFSEFSAPHMT